MYSVLNKPTNINGNYRGVKHGFHGTAIYKKWKAMRSRVRNDKEYISKGISICSEWNDFMSFKEWADRSGFEPHLSIDRINTLGDYEPSNCRWTSAKTQAENQWLRKDNQSGFRGVSFDKQHGKYKVQIQVNGKKVYLGRFDCPIKAAEAFDAYVIDIGSNHMTNFDRSLYQANDNYCRKSRGV